MIVKNADEGSARICTADLLHGVSFDSELQQSTVNATWDILGVTIDPDVGMTVRFD